jgi:hypothetical protein
MQLHVQTASAPFDAGANRQHTARQRTAIQQEVVRLLDDLAPASAPTRRSAPAAAVKAYRWPNRCILQGASRAISVSWFPGSADEHSLGELLVISWRGTVSLPGLGHRGSDEAVAVTQLLLHLEPASFDGWEWRTAAHDVAGLGTSALADYCRGQVQPPDGATTEA